MDEFEGQTTEDLTARAGERRTALQDLFAAIGDGAPTPEQLEQASTLAAEIRSLDAEVARRTEAATQAAAAMEALRSEFAGGPGADPGLEDPEGEPEETEEETEEPQAQPEAQASAIPTRRVATAARRVPRPPAPETADTGMISITASADVEGFATGARINDMSGVARAVMAKTRTFTPPNGDGQTEDLRKYPVAQFRLDFPDDLQVVRGSDDMAVLDHAANEHRLEGNSLVAAGGWCAPSETLYDLCGGEVVDGMVSVPEVQVRRGGIRYTSGIDFSTIYTNTGFTQTEAQAIAGTTKTCYEVPCPTFQEVRLDVMGLCIKIPILTEVGYPEVVERVTSGSMIAHQYKVNASVISRMVTLAGAVRDYTLSGLGSTAVDTINTLELLADQLRQKYRLGQNATMEVILPVWAKSVIRQDFAARQGIGVQAVTDSAINAHFAAINVRVQFVYGFDELPNATDLTYPADFNALIYPAGTYVKGVSDVINLSAVYDAASLAVNTYTGLFMEEGLLVAKRCYEAVYANIPVCSAGRTGAADLTCA